MTMSRWIDDDAEATMARTKTGRLSEGAKQAAVAVAGTVCRDDVEEV
jgi:hypothetical protein